MRSCCFHLPFDLRFRILSIAPNNCHFSFSILKFGSFSPNKQIVAILLQIIEFRAKKGGEQLSSTIQSAYCCEPATQRTFVGTILLPLQDFFCATLRHFLPFVSCICKLGTCALVCLLTAMRPLQTFLRNFNTINNHHDHNHQYIWFKNRGLALIFLS